MKKKKKTKISFEKVLFAKIMRRTFVKMPELLNYLEFLNFVKSTEPEIVQGVLL